MLSVFCHKSNVLLLLVFAQHNLNYIRTKLNFLALFHIQNGEIYKDFRNILNIIITRIYFLKVKKDRKY